ncbi:hypothetical protein FRC04_003624 [Tulasnella sp. 424]|nr:hypothetical protein FRC04_003624 [Tulasnella sp. 424]
MRKPPQTAIVRRQLTLNKFVPMTKPAPPQQSSLNEMWNKKKARPAPKSTEEDVSMGNSEEDTAKPTPSTSRPSKPKAKATNKDDTMEEDGAAVPSKSKGKAKARDEDAMEEDQAPTQKPTTKKRRVVDSDDEAVPSTTTSKKPSSTTAKPASKLKPPPSKKSKPSPAPTTEDEDDPAPTASKPASSQAGDIAQRENEVAEDEDEGESEVDDDEDGAETSAAAKLAATKSTALPNVERKDVEWKDGQPIPYAALAHVFSLIEATTKRLEITSLLTAFLLLVIQRRKKDDHDSLRQAVYLCINRLCPDFVGVELGIGESLLVKAIAESTGRKPKEVQADLKKEGDLGLVAKNSKNSQRLLFKPKPLTVPFVFSRLEEIAKTAGNASQAKKISIITKLLAACQGDEAKYIIRSLEGKLRIRLAERTVLVALAHAAVLSEGRKLSKEQLAAKLEAATNTLKSVYSELPTYDLVIPALLQYGIEKLPEHCKLTPGIPLKPMLAKPTKAIGEVLDRFEGKTFTCEYKYDGERAQVHKLSDGTVAVFSRNSEDMSKKYPDLVEQLPRCIKEGTHNFVLDAEAVAVDKNTGGLLPFQELSKRKRKDVKVEDIQVKVCLFGFDLLYLNGEPLLHKPLAERRELLREAFVPVLGEFAFANSSDSHSVEDIQTFLETSVKDGCEGLMVKMMDSTESHYEPSRRSVNWLKLKKDYLSGVGDSLDLVVVGAYYGKGKRTNVYGAYLLACYDSDSEQFQTICKIGTGFSDEMLAEHFKQLNPLEIGGDKPRGDVDVGGAKPDVWLKPEVVWEVLTADLSLSPIYTAAKGLVDERGISLRFPRFVRARDDKGPEDATGPEQISEMYERQALAQSKGNKKKGNGGEDDFW